MELEYDVVEDLKKVRVNITVFELFKITQLRELLRKALQHIQGPWDVAIGNSKSTKLAKTISVTNTSSVEKKENTTMDKKQPDPKEDGALIGKKSRSQTLPFLLTFDILNRNVHNFLVDSGDSSNMMPYSVCKKLNVKPQRRNDNITQLDRSHVNVLGEIKDVLIHLDSNSKVL